MGVFSDRLEFGSTAALDGYTGQNNGRYGKKELDWTESRLIFLTFYLTSMGYQL